MPDTVGRYRIVGRIGEEEVGEVLAAVDPDLDREVAVVRVHARHLSVPGFAQAFLESGRRCSALQHPGIVPIHDVGEDAEGRPYVVRQRVAGRTLTEALAEPGDAGARLSPLLHVFEQVCDAVAAAHARGVAHGRLTTDAVLVGRFGEVLVQAWGLDVLRPAEQDGEAADVAALGRILDAILARTDPAGDHPLRQLASRCAIPDAAARADAGQVAAAVTAWLRDAEARARALEVEAAEARASAATERRRRHVLVTLALTALFAVLIGAQYLVHQSRAARHLARRIDEVERAVHAARALAADAASRRRADPGDWDRALAAATKAHTLATTQDLGADVEARTAALVDRLRGDRAQAAQDRGMVASLDEIRPHLGSDRPGPEVDADYQRVFAAYGIDVAGSRSGLRQRLERSSILRELAEGLQDWAWVRRGGPLPWRPLLDLADELDRNEWRRELRAAFRARDTGRLRALAAATDVAAIAPHDTDLLARALANLGARDAAIGVYRTAALRHPGDFWILHNYAALLGGTGAPPHAEITRLTSMLTAVRPRSAHAWCDRASAHLSAGELDRARRAAVRATAIDATYARAWATLGLIETRAGRPGDAMRALRAAIGNGARTATAFGDLAELQHGQGMNDAAAATLREGIARFPADPELRTNLGMVLLRLGQPEAAAGELRASLALDDRDVLTHAGLGLALRRRGALDGALDALRTALRLRGTTEGPPLERWIERTEDDLRALPLVEAFTRIEAVPDGQVLRVALVAHRTGRHHIAARLFEHARAVALASPDRAELLQAAIGAAALLAAAGGGEATRWSRACRGWLEHERGTAGVARPGTPTSVRREFLLYWLHAADLAGVRPAALARTTLDPAEQQRWTALWGAVAADLAALPPH